MAEHRQRDAHQNVEPVLPDRDRPRARSDDLLAGRIRTGLRVHVRAFEDRALRHQDHRSHALSPLCGAAHQGRARRHTKTKTPKAWRGARRGERRQGFRVRFAHRRDLPQRLPAGERRQRAAAIRSPTFTATPTCSAPCAIPPSVEASAASANTRRSAAARVRAPSPLPATTWPKTRAASISRTWPTLSQARRRAL